MLTDVDLLAWYTKLGLAENARVAVDHIRSSDPARRVGGGRRNVSGFYPSKKMGVTIQFESHRVELAAVYELEHDDDVLEYFDQPPSLSWSTTALMGGTWSPSHCRLLRDPKGLRWMGGMQDRGRTGPFESEEPQPVRARTGEPLDLSAR